MSDRNKIYATKRLIASLSVVSSTDLEHIAMIVVSLKTGRDINHRGVNEDDKPMGYTVDGFDSENVIIVECSTDKNYFNGSNKIKSDIEHAKSKAPKFEKLYLISNQRCPEGQWSIILNEIDGGKCEVFDNRKLSVAIFELLSLKDSRIDELVGYLPELSILKNESILDYAVPLRVNPYFDDFQVHTAIEQALNDNNCLVIYGISGSGKTSAMIEYVSKHFGEYDSVVWLDSKDIVGRPLQSITVSRIGHVINLMHRFTSCKCLLVIDDCSQEVEINQFRELNDGFINGSKLVVLSKMKCSKDISTVEFPQYTDDIAKKMLFDGIASCDGDCSVEDILNKSYRNPFLLRFINTFIRDDASAWNNVCDVFSQISEIKTPQNEYFIDKLLGEFYREKQHILRELAWLNAQIISIEFLKKFAGQIIVSNLERQLIITKINKQYYKVHDLVMHHLNSLESPLNSEEDKKFAGLLWDSLLFIEEKHLYHFHNCLNLFADRFQKSVQYMDIIPSKRLAIYLQMEDCCKDIVQLLSEFPMVNFANDEYSVMCIIEANERQLISAPTPEKIVVSERLISQINTIIDSVPESFQLRLRHHKAKALVRLNKLSEAWDIFVQNQRCDPDDLSTSLQIARLAVRMSIDQPNEAILDKGRNSVRVILDSIMDATLRMTKSVTYQIESLKLLSRYSGIEDEYARNEVFINASSSLLMHCLIAGNKQAFEGLVPFSRITWFEYPEVLTSLSEYADFPPLSNVRGQLAINIADALKNIGKAFGELNDKASMLKWCSDAGRYYDHPGVEKECYQITMIAENQIILGRYEDAQDTLNRMPADQRNAFWFYRQAQLEFDTMEYTSALESINRSLSSCVPEKFRPAFLKLQGDIHDKTEQYDLALASYSNAILITSSNKFASVLKDAIDNLPKCTIGNSPVVEAGSELSPLI